MMGYRVKRKILNLRFEDPDYAGFECRAHSTSVEKVLDLADQAEAARRGSIEVAELIAAFGDALISWNLEDDEGRPVPATTEGVRRADLVWILPVILAWVDAMVNVSAGLGKDSTSGQRFPEVSIPMEIPSPNLTNSLMQS
jgi:hypothetical protein